jgi:hypothetical protein
MARLSPLPVADAAALLAADLSPAALYEVVLRASASTASPPADLLGATAALVDRLDTAAVDTLAPRPRTALRLLQTRAFDAAWLVVREDAVGAIDAPSFLGPPLPLLTKIDAAQVYADLPGFRDPRFNAPEDSYNISATIGARVHLEEIEFDSTIMALGGSAALDVLQPAPDDHVTVVMASDDTEITMPAVRVHRASLTGGQPQPRARRGWAGWSATVDLTEATVPAGRWSVALEVSQRGVVRRSPIGRSVTDLARLVASQERAVAGRSVRWDISRKNWRLVVDRTD